MGKVIICYKWVLDEADIKINSDFSVDMSKAKGKISDYDKNAIEAAMQSASALGGKVIGLTFGTIKAKQSLKDALSRGLEEVCFINAPEAGTADGAATAKVLAAAVKKLDDVSMVICAEGSSDSYARQTPPRIGAVLDWPVITSVCKMEVKGNTLTAVRKLDNCLETVEVALPAVVAVLPEINQPSIPGLKAVMAAGKKPVSELKVEELGKDLAPKTKVTAVKGYAMNRKNVLLSEGEAVDKVAQLVKLLRKEGVL
jgi:electron transfer flavoprotein beta subunit